MKLINHLVQDYLTQNNYSPESIYKFGKKIMFDMKSMINAAIKAHEAYTWLNKFKETIDTEMRRKELRKGSIDVEFRVIKE